MGWINDTAHAIYRIRGALSLPKCTLVFAAQILQHKRTGLARKHNIDDIVTYGMVGVVELP